LKRGAFFAFGNGERVRQGDAPEAQDEQILDAEHASALMYTAMVEALEARIKSWGAPASLPLNSMTFQSPTNFGS
jgi:hypothetical protein